MGALPGVQHQQAIRALQKIGFVIKRQSKHIILSDGVHTVTVPRNNPINPFTMGTIVKGAGLSIEQFRELL